MRKTAIALLVLGLTAVMVAPALAVSLLSEGFNYADGGLVAVSGGNWLTHSGAGTDIQIVSGKVNGSMAQSPDDNRGFAAQTATAKTYACFTVRIPTPAAAPVLNYFAHFKDATTFGFTGRVYVAPSGATFTFGLSVGTCSPTGTPACNPTLWATALNYDTDYNVVVSYDAAAGSSELWVNPTSEADTKITHNTWSGTASQVGTLVQAYAFRQSTAGVPTGTSSWSYIVDNLGVGSTFNDACNSGPTPTHNGSWGGLKTIYR